jgi:hypothetical protein
MTDSYQEMPPHWFSTAIEDAVTTKNSTQIARTCGTAIANSEIVLQAIEAAIAADNEDLTGRPSLAHAIRQAIAHEIGQ